MASEAMQVNVKSMTGDTTEFELFGTPTVKELKESIAAKLEHPVSKQSLLHVGELLKNSASKLKDVFGTGACEVTLLVKKEIEFIQNFETNASNPSELETHYPHIGAQANITVANGVLIKAGEAKGNIIYRPDADEDLSRIVYEISITCGDDRYNVGLGCLVCPADDESVSRSGSSTRFCFHPGMRGGMFRIEESGGHGNKNIGFTPPAWEEKLGGTKFNIELNKNGNHKVTLKHPQNDSESFTSEWTKASLWKGDSPPLFGIYDGDVDGDGTNTYYTNFSVKGD